MSVQGRILVVDDDRAVVSWLTEALVEAGYDVVGETAAPAAIQYVQEDHFDLVISDVEMPKMRGPDLLRAIHAARPTQMVLLITAFGSIEMAVDAVRAGAVDFLPKPFRIEVLLMAIERCLKERQMRREIVRLRAGRIAQAPGGIATRSQRMLAVIALAQRAARSEAPVLITGESGVGKGAMARLVHESSNRASGPYIQVNCAALPTGLAEAELFGVRRGAFTDAREDRAGVFEQATGGTLMLDEVGELPIEVQPKLLQALESRTIRPLGAKRPIDVNIRIVAATNVSLEDAIRQKQFRLDLFHRLNVVRLEVPPLRNRPEDIVPIVDQVLGKMGENGSTGVIGISGSALRWLERQSWPGNVRELINAVERAVILAERDVLTEDDFTYHPTPDGLDENFIGDAAARELTLEEVENAYVLRVLQHTQGHKGRAAAILGLDRRTLYRKAAQLAYLDTYPPSPPLSEPASNISPESDRSTS